MESIDGARDPEVVVGDVRERQDGVRVVIVSVMESWPLQLTVSDEDGRLRAVGLTQDAVVKRRGEAVDPSELIEGRRVEIAPVDPGIDGGFTTDEVLIID